MGGPGSGRKPLPSHIIQMRGGRVRSAASTVERAEGEPVKPEETLLGIYGSELWDELVPYFVEWGYAGAADTMALTSMCIWWQAFRDEINEGDTRAAGNAFMKFDKIASKFGYTASDRARLKVNDGLGKSSGVATRQRKEGV